MNINRRKFLKTAAIGAAGLTVVPSSILGKAYGHTAPRKKKQHFESTDTEHVEVLLSFIQ